MYTTFPRTPLETLIPPTSNAEFAGKWEKLREVVMWLVMFEPGYRMDSEAAMELLELMESGG